MLMTLLDIILLAFLIIYTARATTAWWMLSSLKKMIDEKYEENLRNSKDDRMRTDYFIDYHRLDLTIPIELVILDVINIFKTLDSYNWMNDDIKHYLNVEE